MSNGHICHRQDDIIDQFKKLCNLRVLFLSPWVVLAVFVLLNTAVGIGAIRWFGHGPASDASWQLATELASGSSSPTTAFRSILPSLLMRYWQELFGSGSISAFIFKLLLYGASLFFIWLIATHMFNNRLTSILSLYFSILSPYLVWSVYVGRDVAADVLAVSALMFFGVTSYRTKKLRDLAVMALTGAFATGIRETNLFVFLALLIFLGLCARVSIPRLILSGTLFLIGLSPLLTWNYLSTGTVVLSTRTGINLLYGNHPNYLEGHPKYDIDVFLGDRVEYEYGSRFSILNEVERDRAYREAALEIVLAEPVEAVYRSLLKAGWWLGPMRIPGSDREARLLPDRDEIILGREQTVGKELLYLLHRSMILILLIVGWKYSSFSWRSALLLALPTLAVMPVAIMTFPDSRFRLALDPYTYILAAAGGSALINEKLGRGCALEEQWASIDAMSRG
jgi:hypothetical protein